MLMIVALFLSPTCMTQWIANLFSHPTPTQDEFSVSDVFIGRDLRLDVQEVSLPCGHVNYFAKLYWYSPEARNWVTIGIIMQNHLDDAIELLQKAKMFIDAQ